MGRFLSPLVLKAEGPGEWSVQEPFRYEADTGAIYIVPVGFVTDLASIPRITRPLIDINGKSRRPAVLHDWLYCLKVGTRSEADSLFLEALKSEGVGFTTRWSMYIGVRTGGWYYWRGRKGLCRSDFIWE